MTLLAEAEAIISGDRLDEYSEACASFARIARLWTALLEHEVSPRDVARCMIALKLSRSTTSDARDNWLDIAGYAAPAAELGRDRTT